MGANTVVNLRSTEAPLRVFDLSKFDATNCPVRDLISQIGGKWSVLLL